MVEGVQVTPGGTQSTHNTSGNDGGMSSDCSDDEGSPGGGPGGGGPVPQIYPWMKKIHVAGAGWCFLLCQILLQLLFAQAWRAWIV